MTGEDNSSVTILKVAVIKKEYGIKTEATSTGNTKVKTNIEIIDQASGNIVRTHNIQEIYVDDFCPWMGIPEATSFAVKSTYHKT